MYKRNIVKFHDILLILNIMYLEAIDLYESFDLYLKNTKCFLFLIWPIRVPLSDILKIFESSIIYFQYETKFTLHEICYLQYLRYYTLYKRH